MRSERSELDGLRDLDPLVLTAIHNQYYPEVYRYARYRLNDDTLAEDITSEVFVCLLEAVRLKRGPRTTLRGWLMGTVANLVNDHFRKSYAHPEELLSEELSAGDKSPLSITEEEDRQQAVHAALLKLTSEQQHVLALRFGDEYSLEDTAAIMGKKVNAVKALQFRALASLRRYLEDEDGEETD